MFASPIDPFHNSALSAEERRQRDMAAMDQQHWQQHLNTSPPHHPPHLPYHHQQQYEQRPHQPAQQDPQILSAGRRKRSLHFEPEFLEALDSSLHDPPVRGLSTPRPNKKARRHLHVENPLLPEPIRTNSGPSVAPADLTAAADAVTTDELDSRRSSVSSVSSKSSSRSPLPIESEGPSIIDLSSGEKLEPLHWGENDHKRRRDSIAESRSSAESLREVFDVQGDGSLRPDLNHAPSLPSPPKRHRTDEPITRGSVCLLDEMDNWDSSYESDIQTMDQDEAMADDSESTQKKSKALGANSMALIRYEGPKSIFLVDGVDSLIRHGWNEHPKDVALDSLQGHELVLYRRPAPTFLTTQETDEDAQESSAFIEEMDDDAHYTSPDNSDDLMNALEERIMDMDLD
ncbi:hypothetical protein BGZ70_004916 [Mortierella alpina]|uniref:Uncharacterized protein n=1 Tax=Mortierella alpina TaxID=64518 RepID=A0A9P6M4L8_MORAP|nr:hypothetical protein BGZ70_004916 [Mortierella alpina]